MNRISPACVLISVLAASLPAQGVLTRGIYVDEKEGFSVKPPQGWTQVPTQVDEKWIVAQFQSNREYEGHHKLDGDFVTHRPLMRVILFDEAVIKQMVSVEKTEDSTVKKIKLPYRDYKDYVKRNLNKGGFYFSEEKETKLGGEPVTLYEVKVEKLAYGGRKQFVAYVFHGQGVHYAVEFEFLMHHFDKLKSQARRSFSTFKVLPRAVAETAGTKDPASKTFGNWLRLDWKKKTAAERHRLRKDIEKVRIQKSIEGLPQGWTVSKSRYFTVLSHGSKKFTKRLTEAADTCRAWIDKRFGDLNDEYVSRGIIRICANREEYSAYRSGSADAFSLDDRELTFYEDKDVGNIGEWRGLFRAVFYHYMTDKDDLIYENTPMWLGSALHDYFLAARIKGRDIDFRVDEYEPDAFRTLRRAGKKVLTAREIMEVTYERYRKGNKEGLEMDEQIVTFFRFLEGPAKRMKLVDGDFVLRYIQESVKAAEVYKEANPTERRKEATTEAEEEAQADKKDSSREKRREAVCMGVNKALFKDWSKDDWEKLERAYTAYLKQQKYL